MYEILGKKKLSVRWVTADDWLIHWSIPKTKEVSKQFPLAGKPSQKKPKTGKKTYYYLKKGKTIPVYYSSIASCWFKAELQKIICHLTKCSSTKTGQKNVSEWMEVIETYQRTL